MAPAHLLLCMGAKRNPMQKALEVSINLPDDTKRHVIVGSTGSGKTQCGIWHLSLRDYLNMPWVIFDFKGDDLIAEIGAKEISVNSAPPKKPGLYVVRPLPETDDASVEAFLMKCWAQEDIGLYIDEGYMIPNDSKAFKAILTQGRSKHIPVIVLSQRPVWLSRFVFSEADFYQVFRLNDKRDRQTVKSFLPFDVEERLPDYHSYWYDVGNDFSQVWKPVPSKGTIIKSFRDNLRTPRTLL